MAERPPIRATGKVVEVLKEDHLYRVEMQNGYVAYAILERSGPRASRPVEEGNPVEVRFSPFDMSRCKILAWPEQEEQAS